MYLLDVSIRYLKYFCVLFVLIVLFVYAVSFVAMLHLHLRWFYILLNQSFTQTVEKPGEAQGL